MTHREREWREHQQGQRFNSSRQRARKGPKEKEFTVFINNLPQNLDRFGLKGIFQRAGEVKHAYIPASCIRRKNGKYGFVRFKSQAEALRSITMINNILIRGKRVQASMAKYGKPGWKEHGA